MQSELVLSGQLFFSLQKQVLATNCSKLVMQVSFVLLGIASSSAGLFISVTLIIEQVTTFRLQTCSPTA